MSTKTIVAIAIVVVVVGGVAFFLKSGGNNQTPVSTGPTKFADSEDWPYAHPISGDTLDAAASASLAGFQLSKSQLPDGSRTFTLQAMKSGYQTQTYTLLPGQQLYFIERSLGDDSSDQDLSLRDDMAVVVGSDGYPLK